MARKLAERTGLPWHSVDDLTWNRAGSACRQTSSDS
jgi:hypothetical protein